MEPPVLAPLLARLPITLFWGLFGYFFAEATDIMAVFRRGGAAQLVESARALELGKTD
jgi:hypothetical protein